MSSDDSKITDPLEAFDLLRFKKTRFIIFKISNLKIFPALISHRNKNYTDLLDELTDTSPAFICYDYEYMSKDGRPIDKMYCIYWKPENTSQSARIVYSQALHNFRTSLSGVENVDVEDFDELKALLEKEEQDPRRLAKE